MSPLLKPKFDPKLPIKPFRAYTPITLILLAIFGAKNQMRYFFPFLNTVFAVASLCTRMYRMYTRERLQNVQHKVVQKKLIRCCILTKNPKETSKNVIRSWIHFESLNKGKIGLLNLFSLTSTSSSSISCIHYKWPPCVSNSTYSSTNRRIWTKAKKIALWLCSHVWRFMVKNVDFFQHLSDSMESFLPICPYGRAGPH